MAGRSSNWLNLDRFRYTGGDEAERDYTKPNGKPVIRSSEYGAPSFETGFDLCNVVGNPEKCLMQCGVCLCLPRYPVELSHCGHVFCFICAMRTINFQPADSITGGAPCPNCKRLFMVGSIVAFKRDSQALQNIYNGFDIRCVYGCPHVCSPSSMLEHEVWACPERPVACIYKHCRTVLPDKAMEAHLDLCPHRLVYCGGCFLPRKFDGTDHSCVLSSRETIRGTLIYYVLLSFFFRTFDKILLFLNKFKIYCIL